MTSADKGRSAPRTEGQIAAWLDKAASDPSYAARTAGWERITDWIVDGHTFRFRAGPGGFIPVGQVDGEIEEVGGQADLTFELDQPTLDEITAGRLPFFIALWGLDRIKYHGPFGDANRLGFILGADHRSRRVAFVAHCWLNLNTRFPGGGSHPGAHPSVAQALVDSGVGIIQMPCPEHRCFGLEKHRFGDLSEDQVRACFRRVAEGVVEDIAAYRDLDFDVVAVIGMDPSPSCGVTAAKGKGTLLGTNRDTSEVPGRQGLFIESLGRVAAEKKVLLPPVLGLRRVLSPEEGDPEGLAEVRRTLNQR